MAGQACDGCHFVPHSPHTVSPLLMSHQSDMDFDDIFPGKSKTEENGDAENDYEVEKILRKRVKNGKVEYYLKWRGFGMEDCTWEPREHLTCEDLIRQFEDDEKESRPAKAGPGSRGRPSKSNGEEYLALTPVRDDRDVGSDPFLENPMNEPQEIVEVGQRSGQLCFRVKWSGETAGTDWVPTEVANLRCPHIVLRYYKDLLSGQIVN